MRTICSPLKLSMVIVLVGAMACTVILNGCGESSEPQANIGTEENPVTELNFGFVSMESNAGLKVGFDPFIEDMSEELGIPVKSYFAPDYAGIIEGMRFGKVDVAWFGNKSGMEAVDRANGEVFAHNSFKDGTTGYWSLIIVNADSDLETIDDVIERGSELDFGNGDPNSTSGYLIPQHYLWGARGIDPATHFKRMVNANHETNIMAVASGQVDFATNNTLHMEKFTMQNPELAEKIRVIWKSPKIPSDPIVYRGELPENAKQKIRDFILEYGQKGDNVEQELEVLANMSTGWGPFGPSDNSHLIPVREISIAKEMMKIRNNESLDVAEKAQQLKPLQAKLAELQKQREN